MSFILLVVLSTGVGPKSFTLSEFRSKAACEIALKEAKKFYRTVNDSSKCISVQEEIKRSQLEDEDDEVDGESV